MKFLNISFKKNVTGLLSDIPAIYRYALEVLCIVQFQDPQNNTAVNNFENGMCSFLLDLKQKIHYYNLILSIIKEIKM
jgi:hypothetical protein